MYSVSGIALDNSGFGWVFRGPSTPLSQLLKQSQSLRIPGRDEIESLPSTLDAPVIALVVQTPRVNLEALYALFLQPKPTLALTATPWRSVEMEYLNATLAGYGDADAIVDVTFMMRLNGVFWRDTTESTSPAVALSAASVSVPLFSGLSAPVRDAVIRVGGAASGLRVADSRGSWFEYPAAIPAGKYLLFVPERGIARIQGLADSWDDYESDVSGLIVNGPGPYFLEMTPTFTNPSQRVARLTVTTTSRSGASIQVRGRGAYLV